MHTSTGSEKTTGRKPLSDSLTINTANMFARMTTIQISQNIQTKIMRSELQQSQALAQMLDEQAKAIQSFSYDRSGSVIDAGPPSTIYRKG
jgi:hypothetical protein